MQGGVSEPTSRVAGWHLSMATTTAFSAIDTTQASASLEDLRQSNIFLDIFGRPCPGMQPGRMFDFESPTEDDEATEMATCKIFGSLYCK